uniref:LITAF domain-containing protein n=1 Tax=Pseudictyota dubia TaxID=2749911 RepID=A0A6U2DBE3_9STRA
MPPPLKVPHDAGSNTFQPSINTTTTGGANIDSSYVYIEGAVAQQHLQPGSTVTYLVPPEGGLPVAMSQQPGQSVVYPVSATPSGAAIKTSSGLIPNIGRSPVQITCPYCKNMAKTNVREEMDECAVTNVVVLFLFFFPLSWLPLVIPGVSVF